MSRVNAAWDESPYALLDLARALERELAEARATVAQHVRIINSMAEAGKGIEAENAALREALTHTLSWLTSYPGGGPLHPGGAYEQARAALGDPVKSQSSQCGGFLPGADPRYCLHCGIKIECHAGPIPANHDEHMEGNGQ